MDTISKRKKSKKKLFVGVVLGVILSVALIFFFIFDPETTPIFPKCPFLLLTGYECPGCGTQRAIHSLLHLRFADAFRYNAFMVIALPYVVLAIYLEYFGGNKRFPRLQNILYGKEAAWLWLIFIFAYWIGRNIV